VSTAAPVALPPPAASEPGVVERIVRSPGRFCLGALVMTTLGLGLDHFADLGLQLLLSVCAWAFLAVVFVYLTPMERAQTSVVVIVATMAEVIGSILWGVYAYRLGNLPLFVPPGHGFVYLTGLRMSQTRWAAGRPRLFVGLAIAVVTGWALLGLILLERTDVAGAIGAAVLVVFLLRGRAPAVYAGVFFAVAYLEIYGTAVGTWRWAPELPGLGVPDGNPPSGAASGYVLFDIAALYLAPLLIAGSAAVGARLRRPRLTAPRSSPRGTRPPPRRARRAAPRSG
jgi:hypothetical protein